MISELSATARHRLGALALATTALLAHAADVTVTVDGAPVKVSSAGPDQPLRVTFQAQAGQRLGIAVDSIAFEPPSASGIGLTVRQPGGATLRGMDFLYCPYDDQHRACDGEFTVARSGKHVIDIEAPFSAAPRLSLQLSSAVGRPLAVDKPQEINLQRPGQDGWFPLDVAAGQQVSVDLRNLATPDPKTRFALRVYRPDRTLLGEGSATPSFGASVSLGSAPAGKYLVEVDPERGATGTFLISAKTAARMAEGVTQIASAVNEPVRFTFVAKAGQSVTVGLNEFSHEPDVDSNSVIAILKPDGTRLTALGCSTPSRFGGRSPCTISGSDLAAGTYTVLVTPPPGASVSGKLYRTTDIVANLDPDSPNPVETQPGQVARFTYSAKAGEKWGLSLKRLEPGDGSVLMLQGMGPGNRFFTRGLPPAQNEMRIEPVVSPSAGDYTIIVGAGFKKASASLSLIRGAP